MAAKRVHYPTIKDVAELAHTSTATVSYVLNEDPSRAISTELREQVLDAAKKLNYSKSAAASNLRASRSGMVFILIPQFNNIYYTRVCEKIEDVLYTHDFLPIISDTREDPERERKIIQNAVEQRADGVILGPTYEGWKNTSLLRERNIPYVTIGREMVPEDNNYMTDNTYFVGDNSYQAGFQAGRCLVKNGHRQIGVLEWSGEVSSTTERSRGFDDAVSGYIKAEGFMEKISSTELSVEEGYRMTKSLLQRVHPTALFFGYHNYALGGIQYLNEAGYTVPDDISVIIIGTPSWAEVSSPKYHLVYQNEDWVGERAGRILMAQLTKEEDLDLLQEKRHVCACTVVEGESVKDLTKCRKDSE